MFIFHWPYRACVSKSFLLKYLRLFVYKCVYLLFFFFVSLKPIDIVVLKKLSEVVNVVPVIAKSDSLTIDERQAFKQRVSISTPSLLFIFIKTFFFFGYVDQG